MVGEILTCLNAVQLANDLFWAVFGLGQIANLLKSIALPIRIMMMLLADSAFAARFAKVLPIFTPMSDGEAATELNRALNRRANKRKKDAEQDNRLLIKVNDAMKSVDEHIGVGHQLVDLSKSIGNLLAGSVDSNGLVERLHDEIRGAMLAKVLRQDRPRIHKKRTGWFRPGARG